LQASPGHCSFAVSLIFGPDDFWNIKTLSAGGFHEQLFAIGLSFIALFCLVVAPHCRDDGAL
jgi:hypothetical protein